MPKQTFALEAGGEKRLEVSWGALYKNTTVSLDGSQIGIIQNQKALSAGQEFRLPDGSTIKVQLVNKFMMTELQVHRNGQPLPGSVSDPLTRLKNAYSMVYLVAGLNLVLGIVSSLLNIKFLQLLGIGLNSILFGLVFFALGFFVQRKSTIALILAIVIFAVDGIAGFFVVAAQGYTPSVGGIFGRIILLVPMAQGVGAIRALKLKGD